MVEFLTDWIGQAPAPLLGGLLLLIALGAAFLGRVLRVRSDREEMASGSGFASDQEGYIVSGVLGLLALMMGFTFAMAIDRFDTRRHLVLEEANAIGTTYLRAQLVGEPHRTRLSNLLIEYTANRITLGTAPPNDVPKLLADNDRMVTDLWAASAAAFDSISNLDFSSSFVESVNTVIDLDTSRKASYVARVPGEVLVVLSGYIVVTAGVMGYVLTGFRGKLAGMFLITLLTVALSLIIDLDRPRTGGIRVSQVPMEILLASLKQQPPEIFDRYRDAHEAH